jgi:GntR family transcriptional repressor for pyruvate dehydrogenase complex
MLNKYKPIKQTKTSDLIVREIWSLILNGDLKPGDKLPPERELGKNFKVSMVTLREALQTLEAHGHISKKRGAKGGSIVLDIAPTQGVNLLVDYIKAKHYSIGDLIEAKRLIDPLIGEVAKKRLTAEGKAALKLLIEEHENDYKKRGASRRGWDLYILLGSLTQNPILAIISELLTRIMIDTEFSLGISDLESPKEQDRYNRTALQSHKKVVDAFTSGDVSKVKKDLRRNSQAFASVIKELSELYSKDR